MDITALQPHLKASSVPLDQLAGNPNVTQSDKVKEACRQFEAVLLRQILKDARKPVGPDGQEDESAATGIYNDMINNQMADCISRSGSFGLAKSLENQLVNQVLPKALGRAQPESGAKPAVPPADK